MSAPWTATCGEPRERVPAHEARRANARHRAVAAALRSPTSAASAVHPATRFASAAASPRSATAILLAVQPRHGSGEDRALLAGLPEAGRAMLETALGRGLDPDAPANLSRVVTL